MRDIARKRSREQIAARKAKGLQVGRPPYGSRPGEDPAMVVATYHEAGSFHEAARLLNARGVPTSRGRGSWHGRSVQQVVRRVEPVDITSRRRVRSRGRYILTGLPVCHCGKPMTVFKSRWGVSILCAAGKASADHLKPIEVSEAKLLPWVQAEAARLRAPESVTVAVTRDEDKRNNLAARRQRVVDAFVDGAIGKEERDRRLAGIDRDLEAIGARLTVAELPTIDWSWAPENINLALRALWHHIVLDENLRPVRAEWTVPEWRA
jgi:hypothetical protein